MATNPLVEPLELLIKLVLDCLNARGFGVKDYRRRQSGIVNSRATPKNKRGASGQNERRQSHVTIQC